MLRTKKEYSRGCLLSLSNQAWPLLSQRFLFKNQASRYYSHFSQITLLWTLLVYV